jgi:hypothetical protein
MQGVREINTDVFGLYELAVDGTILHSRPRTGEFLRDPKTDVIGQDFFHDIFTFQNTEDLRRHFRRFVSGDRPVDAFLFDCLDGSEIVRTKVFMTKAFESDYEHSGDIVIMDIRKAGR